MRLVIDASAAVEIALDRRGAARLVEIVSEADEVLAPELLVAEVVNTVWKYHQFEGLDLNTCDRALRFAVGLVDTLVSHKEICHEAFHLSRSERRRAAYDMFYLALARREDAAFMTLDNALRKEAVRQGIRIP